MKIHYASDKIERYCTDARVARREFNKLVADKLEEVIWFIGDAENLQLVIDRPSLNFHWIDRQGKWRNIYSIYLGRKLGFRLMVRPLNADGSLRNNTQIFPAAAIEIVDIRIEGVSKHYE